MTGPAFLRETDRKSLAGVTKRGPPSVDAAQKDALSISPDMGREGGTEEERERRGDRRCVRAARRTQTFIATPSRNTGRGGGVTQKVRRILPANPCRASENLGAHRANENVQKAPESSGKKNIVYRLTEEERGEEKREREGEREKRREDSARER